MVTDRTTLRFFDLDRSLQIPPELDVMQYWCFTLAQKCERPSYLNYFREVLNWLGRQDQLCGDLSPFYKHCGFFQPNTQFSYPLTLLFIYRNLETLLPFMSSQRIDINAIFGLIAQELSERRNAIEKT